MFYSNFIKKLSAVSMTSFTLALASISSTAIGDEKHDMSFGEWSSPVNLSASSPGINTAAREGCQVLSPDGLSLLFASDQPDASRDETRKDLDLWVAERAHKNMLFSTPRNLGSIVNSVKDEVCPTLSKNGKRLYFASNRDEGCGDRDLYFSTRENKHDNFNWQDPVHLGCDINSDKRDHGASYFKTEDDGELLYFSSNRPTDDTRFSGHNIYVVKIGRDGVPKKSTLNLVDGLNTTNSESRPFLRKDGLEIFFDKDIGDGNREDLWVATRNSQSEPFSDAKQILSVASAGRNIRPALNQKATTLYFTSTRSVGSLGRADIWVTTRDMIENQDDSNNAHDNDDEDDDDSDNEDDD